MSLLVRTVRLAALSIALFWEAGTAQCSACGLGWNAPQGHFDGVDEQGRVSWWQQIGSVKLGEDMTIPIIIGFESGNHTSSPYLGDGWTLALLDSHIVQIDDKRFLMVQPDGWTSRFGRKDSSDTTLTGEKGWLASIQGNQISVWAKCGWKMVYTDGKITSITTPQNRQLTYIYENGSVREVDLDSAPVLLVDRDPQSGDVSGLSVDGKQMDLSLGTKPQIQLINRTRVLGALNKSLRHVTMLDGSSESFKFGVDSNMQPTLTVNGKEQRSFSWDSSSGLINRDGNWIYTIIPHGNQFSNSEISRSNPDDVHEYWYSDGHNGIETILDALGTTHIKKWFTTGILRGKTREEDEINNRVVTVVVKNTYDENGNLIRKFDHGKSIVYKQFGATMKPLTITNGDELVWNFSYDQSGKLLSVNTHKE